jgi:ERCC4-related helicase
MLSITPRLYQEKIFNAAINQNTLVVLPTGLGKTAIAALMIKARLTNYKNSKIIFLAPTKPLAQQHETTLKNYLPEYETKIALFTGSVSPEKRELLWKENTIIISTPQGLENDVIRRKIELKDVSLIIFDEAHRATGDYAYVFLAKKYVEQSNYVRILALTASPGSDQEKVLEVCKNMFIEQIEYRSKEDLDVKPYVQEMDIQNIEVELPEEFKKIKLFLEKCYFSKLDSAKALGILTGDPKSYNKSNLLQLMAGLHGQMRQGSKDYETLKTISLLAESLKVQHALELIETQGLKPTILYLKQLRKEADTSKVKAVKNLVMDPNFKNALILAESFDGKIVHPKIDKLKELVASQIKDKKDSKIIIFTQYRDSGTNIKDSLFEIDISSELFVGQAKKSGTGLSQKKQKEMIESFASSNFSCLIATSVGEEGLDIPEVDLVIFYEPVPSAIRSVQRRGRTGRQKEGKVFMLITKGTRDEIYRWSSFHKEKRMYRVLENIKTKITPSVELKEKTLQDFDEEKIIIKADYREKGSALLKELLSQGVDLDLENLPVGDYHISKEVVLEFKTIGDFVDSILDGRLLSQARDLKQYKKPFILLQGDEDLYSQRMIHPNAIRGMIASLSINFGIPIIRTMNPKDSAEFIKVIAKREQVEKDDFQMHQSKPLSEKAVQEYIVSSFPGIGISLAKPILEQFKTIKNFVNASEDELKKVDLIGQKKANKIKEIVEKEYLD